MRAQKEGLRGGLSLCLSGFGFWSHDISGFEATATPDIYKRWAAFGLLSSHSRLHGNSSYRVPWLFDEEAVDVLRYFTQLKGRLMPYIFSQAVQTHEEGIPMMRAMMLEFNEDPACDTLDRQYMLGDSLLIAPIFNERGEVTYYLPKGKWTNLITKEVIEGGRYVTQTFDYFALPLMVRENTLLPLGEMQESVSYDYLNHLTLQAYQITDQASCKVYDNEVKNVVEIKAKTVEGGLQITLSKAISHIKLVLCDKEDKIVDLSNQTSVTILD